MEVSNLGFWLFLAATVVASLTFVSVAIWTGTRFQERKEFYRFEFRKRLVDAGKMDAAAFAALMQYEHDLKLQESREKLRVAAFVLLGVGLGMCVGFQFIGDAVWMLGFIPIGLGVFMFLFGILTPKVTPGPPPAGWYSEGSSRD